MFFHHFKNVFCDLFLFSLGERKVRMVVVAQLELA